MGYKGVDTTELVLEGHRISADQVLGGESGKGFYQMMDGVEVGRVNVAARACGVANRAFELAIAYAQQRETFGKPFAQHQAKGTDDDGLAGPGLTGHGVVARPKLNRQVIDKGEWTNKKLDKYGEGAQTGVVSCRNLL